MAADTTIMPKIQHRNGGDLLAVASGGILDVESGGALKLAGTDVTALLAAAVANPVGGVSAGYKIKIGRSTTVAAEDTIATGLAMVVAVIASLDSDPVDDPFMVTATIGDQAGSPAAGSFILKTWKNTGGTDPTPAAATTFSKVVNWIAIGT